MARNLNIVANRAARVLIVLTDPTIAAPLDVSAATVTVTLRIKDSAGGNASTVTCTKLTGRQLPSGGVSTAAPYDQAGRGGRVLAEIPASSIPAAGAWRGEVTVTDTATNTAMTPFDLITLTAREEL